MRRTFLFVLVGLLTCGESAWALQITHLDAGNFPRILLRLQMDGRWTSEALQERLQIEENGQRVDEFEITSEVSSLPVGIALMIDTSGSMKEKRLERSVAAAEKTLLTAGPGVSFALMTFDEDLRVLHPLSEPSESFRLRLRSLTAQGKHTALRDTLYDALRTMLDWPVPIRRMILFTDGQDEQSDLSTDDVLAFAQRRHIPIHVVDVGDQPHAYLRRLTKLTGGTYLTDANVPDATWFASEEETLLSVQYEAPTRGPEERLIQVMLRLPGNEVSVSDRYLAPPAKVAWYRTWWWLLPGMLLGMSGWAWWRRKKSGKRRVEKSPEFQKSFDATRAWLEIVTDSGRQTYPLVGTKIMIGRAPSNDIVLDAPSVSKHHAQIVEQNGVFRIYDLRSTNGVWVNGQRMSECPLYDGDTLRLGEIEIIFRAVSAHQNDEH